MLEKDLENAVVKYAEEQTGLALKLRIDGKNGWPDRTFIFNGYPAFSIEFKTPKGKPSDAQLKYLELLSARGYKMFIVDNFEDAKTIIDGRGAIWRIPLYLYKKTSHNYLKGGDE